jgi:hypothetical protein
VADYIAIAFGLVIDTDGEIIEAAGIDDAMKFIAAQRHDAKQQEKEWAARVEALDRVLLRKQQEKRLAYDDIVVSIGGGTYSKTDAEKFAELLWEMPLEMEDVFCIISAASGFKKDKLPAFAEEAYAASTEVLEKRAWIESRVARKRAPRMLAEQPEANDD